ncbi:MAG: hypothetical protein A3G33_11430 [Omnitrophica bacterium RIFCSPLOWO2_12_FULL_44_17]|uniref:DUF2029 domain-containing protein n=1 Tax=Candidatus Danuiimicrobium aquiferis TaxID=1801832 RepID=A0A1G1KRN8_9BACT|nr:MAG: hypothetical protein A3B72_09265 [Omnitrophica bacterium RIFCSPHIGHO2_02_FULL_45_28]OGW91201.1 MAG: hypothetical protein A3E74_02800 [Omnitrophica bacterium RIFCSPHIGHO2_12_FULL_44_12]OGW95601.1 MAG: hypothetical protein A3G33_11430 [Omnitrophica bacterium RIFCSPLOWO2_12_FULL_44_17]OGX03685.1 MAG: hypothetical protein A3J12_01065 [Omnitrophica bacterium RIFCSPLOWO2_02_FULL_44_11]
MNVRRNWLIAGLIIVLVVITGLISVRRSQRGSNDFDTYYKAGRAVIQGSGIYYVTEGNNVPPTEDHVSPFLYPPVAACFFAAFAVLPLSIASFCWNALNVCFFFWALVLSWQIMQPRPPNLLTVFQRIPKFDAVLFVGIGFSCLIDNLAMAQVNILVFLLTVISIDFWRKKREFWGGVILSCAILIKVTPALFCLYFLVKRKPKFLAGTLAGGIVLTLLIPTLIFGMEGNRIYHRQWIGRNVKPLLINVIQYFKKEAPHPDKKTPEQIRMMHLTSNLLKVNQSLEATITRLFLKNRNQYGPERGYPTYVVRHYEKLPVIGGGVSLETLETGVRIFELCLLIGLMFLFLSVKAPAQAGEYLYPLEFSLIYLTMTLISPITRSQHMVVWLFPILAAIWMNHCVPELIRVRSVMLLRTARTACVIYFLQGLPYGQAIGMGTWANLILWCGITTALLQLNKTPQN